MDWIPPNNGSCLLRLLSYLGLTTLFECVSFLACSFLLGLLDDVPLSSNWLCVKKNIKKRYLHIL